LTSLIRGTAEDPAGRPIPHARAYVVSGPGAFPDVAAVADEHGRFTLAAPAPGTYVVGCSADAFESTQAAVEVAPSGETHLRIRLNRPA
jgi:hypothetical protein